jgi:hypothetical protein
MKHKNRPFLGDSLFVTMRSPIRGRLSHDRADAGQLCHASESINDPLQL